MQDVDQSASFDGSAAARRSAQALYAVIRKRFALLACLSLAGCDTFYGVSRYTDNFSPAPLDSCVIEAVESIDGISKVTFQVEDGGRPLTLHGIEKPDQIHRFWYEYKGIRNNFYFAVTYQGAVEYHHGYGCLNCRPPQAVIDKIYPVFASVEGAIEAHCGLVGFKARVKEGCAGVRCGGV